MKLSRTYLFIAITSIALLIVLAIQCNWIYQTAKIKENLFNEKAILVLSKTAEALGSDTTTLKNIQVCVGRNETHVIDSLFKHYMKMYNIHIDYTFEVKQSLPLSSNIVYTSSIYPFQSGSYQTCISDNKISKQGTELKLIFPEKEDYIIAEMGMPFISSVILIFIVLIITSRTILSLFKEKAIFEHTNDFLNNMTHEFKTPLTNIALAGKMIQKEMSSNNEEKIKHYTEIILDENKKLKLQVDQVLSMNALERGEIPLQKEKIDLHLLINETVKRAHLLIENKKGKILTSLNAQNLFIHADKTHFINALYNLIDNAVKYSETNPEITIETADKDDKLIIRISDDGIGIEKLYHKKIFDKYFRVPTGNIHEVKGFGLGLPYVKKIIELHNGTIEIKSERGNGTEFCITIPHA